MRRFLAFLGLPVLAVLASAAGKQPITGADVLKIRNVTSVAVASDGSFAVYGVQSIHTDSPADPKGEPAYKYRTHLWRIDLNNPNARPEQLTFGDRSDSSPAISPDNRTLAFVRVDRLRRASQPQVWLLPLRGPGEAQAVTKLENGAAAPVWRPDGKALLVTTPFPSPSWTASRTSTWRVPAATGSIGIAPRRAPRPRWTRAPMATAARCATGWRGMPRRTTRPSSIASTSSASRTCSTRWKSPNWSPSIWSTTTNPPRSPKTSTITRPRNTRPMAEASST